MLRSVFHGDTKPLAVIKPNQILTIVSLLGDKKIRDCGKQPLKTLN